MTISATCPKGHTLTLEEKLAGKKIRCPRCQVVFQVPDLEAEEVEEAEAVSEKPIRRARRRDDDDDDEDERPRRKARAPVRDDDDDDDDDRPRGRTRAAARDDDDDDEEEMDDETRRKLERRLKKKQLKLVDVGLLLHYIKLCMYIIGIVMLMTLGILTAIAGAQTAEAAEGAKGGAPAAGGIQGMVFLGYGLLVLLVFFTQLVISMIAPLLGVVGSFLCCWVPKKSEAKGTIITSLTFDLISLIAWLLNLLAVAGVYGMEANKTQNMIFLLQGISLICTVTSWLTFLTFMRSLGAYLGEAALGNEALNLIARLVVQVVTLILDFMIIVAFGRYFVGVIVAIFIAIGAMTIWFIFFIFTFYLRQLKLVSAMRQAVQNKL